MKKVKQNQPKHHIGKSKDVVKVRRKKILKALIEGKTQEQAGIEAGLSPHTAQSQVSQILMNPNEKASFKELLDEVVPDGILVKKYHS